MTDSSPNAWRRAAEPSAAPSFGAEPPDRGAAPRARAPRPALPPEPPMRDSERALAPAGSTALTVERVSQRALVADFTLIMIVAPVVGVIAAVAMLGLGREFAERIGRPPTILAAPVALAPAAKTATPVRDEADPAPRAPAAATAAVPVAAQADRLRPARAFHGLETAAAEARSAPLASRRAFAPLAVGGTSAPAQANVAGREADQPPESAVIHAADAARLAAASADAAPDAAALGAVDAPPSAPRAGHAPMAPAPGGLADIGSVAAIDRTPAAPENAAPDDAAPAASAVAQAGPEAAASNGAAAPVRVAMMVDPDHVAPDPSAEAAPAVSAEPEGYGVAPGRSERPTRSRLFAGVAPRAAEPPTLRPVRPVRAVRSARSVRPALNRAPDVAEPPSPRPAAEADPQEMLRRMRDGTL